MWSRRSSVRSRYPTPGCDRWHIRSRTERSDVPYPTPGCELCGYSTVVSIQVFQTWDESSILSTRTRLIRNQALVLVLLLVACTGKCVALTRANKKRALRGSFFYLGSNRNATVPAAAPRIIVIIMVTTNPTFESFSGFWIIVTGPCETSSFDFTTFF